MTKKKSPELKKPEEPKVRPATTEEAGAIGYTLAVLDNLAFALAAVGEHRAALLPSATTLEVIHIALARYRGAIERAELPLCDLVHSALPMPTTVSARAAEWTVAITQREIGLAG